MTRSDEPMGDFIETHTNKHMYVLDPRPQMICLEDIAHALSQQCRFNGHTRRFYSVAEHSWLLSYYAPPHRAAEALLHDAAEAYIGDWPRPIKQFVAFILMKNNPTIQRAHPGITEDMILSFKDVEERLLRDIGDHLKVRLFPISDTVKKLDNQLLVSEYLVLINESLPLGLDGIPPLPLKEHAITGLLPSVAKAKFLARAQELGIGS